MDKETLKKFANKLMIRMDDDGPDHSYRVEPFRFVYVDDKLLLTVSDFQGMIYVTDSKFFNSHKFELLEDLFKRGEPIFKKVKPEVDKNSADGEKLKFWKNGAEVSVLMKFENGTYLLSADKGGFLGEWMWLADERYFGDPKQWKVVGDVPKESAETLFEKYCAAKGAMVSNDSTYEKVLFALQGNNVFGIDSRDDLKEPCRRARYEAAQIYDELLYDQTKEFIAELDPTWNEPIKKEKDNKGKE